MRRANAKVSEREVELLYESIRGIEILNDMQTTICKRAGIAEPTADLDAQMWYFKCVPVVVWR